MTDHVETTGPRGGGRLDPMQILFWLSVALGVAAAGVAVSAGPSVGRAGAILLILLAGGGMVLFFWLSRGAGRSFGAFPERGVVAAAALQTGRIETMLVEALDEAAMVTDASLSPLVANSAYMRLAEAAGTLGDSDRPPMMNRLFGADPLLSAPMFRLSKAAGAMQRRRETLPPTALTADSTPVRYEAAVGPAPGGRVLWRLRELSAPDGEAPADEGRRVFLDDAPIGFFLTAPDGAIAYVNRALRAVLGLGEASGELRLKDLVKEDSSRFLRRDRRNFGPAPTRITLKARDGAETSVTALTFWSDDERDLSARTLVFFSEHEAPVQRAPAAVGDGRASGAMFENAPFGAAVLDCADPASAVLLDSNPALMEMTGGAAAPGVAFADLFEASDGPTALAQKLRGALDQPTELMLAASPPISAHVHFSRADDGRGLAYVVNVSQQRELEQRLAQSEKMREIGELAAGVAHDFNNMLTIVMQTTSYLLRRHPAGDADFPMLQEISENATSARELSEMLRAYGRQQTFAREVFYVGDFIGQRQELFRRILGEAIAFSIRHAPDLPYVKVDKTQFERVLVNLATNARDAMTPKGARMPRDGKLSMRTSRISAVEARALGHKPIEEGEYVLVEVEDSGCGIKPEDIPKLFRPFFSTKDASKGTGLGLATSYGIIKQSGGYLFCDSKLGVGTTFRVFLPAYEPTPEEVAELAERERALLKPASQDVAGRGRILFVEDMAPVRRSIMRNLVDCGYEVDEACNGEEALEMLTAKRGVYDLIISDVAMPIMTGPEMLRAAGPEMIGRAKVLFLSGYAPESFSDMLEEFPVFYMSKPVTMEQLVARVKDVLAG